MLYGQYETGILMMVSLAIFSYNIIDGGEPIGARKVTPVAINSNRQSYHAFFFSKLKTNEREKCKENEKISHSDHVF